MAPPFPFSCPERIQKYFQLSAALCNGHFIPIRAFIEKITEYTATTRIRHEARLPQTVHRMIRERGVQSCSSPGARAPGMFTWCMTAVSCTTWPPRGTEDAGWRFLISRVSHLVDVMNAGKDESPPSRKPSHLTGLRRSQSYAHRVSSSVRVGAMSSFHRSVSHVRRFLCVV